MMLTYRSRVASLLFGLTLSGLSLAACSSPPDITIPPSAGAEALTEEATAPEASGLPRPFEESLARLALRADQQPVVDQVRADLVAQRAPLREARKALAAVVADGVAAGALDPKALAAPIERVTKAAEAFEASMQGALNKLHATLDAAQRKELVAGMRAHGKERFEARRGEAKAESKGAHPQHGHMAKLAAELGLTEDQVRSMRESFKAERASDKAEAGLHEARGERGPKEMRGHFRALAQAFEGDAFDAAALGMGKELPKMAGFAVTRRLRFVEHVLPVLTPEQRQKFAGMLRAKTGPDDANEEG